jgi:hypothetical protein
LSQRFPGANRVRRSALVAIGPNYQHHADGHDKLNAQALAMGGVSPKTNGRHFYYIWSSFRTTGLQRRSVMCTLILLINMNVCTNLLISLL